MFESRRGQANVILSENQKNAHLQSAAVESINLTAGIRGGSCNPSLWEANKWRCSVTGVVTRMLIMLN